MTPGDDPPLAPSSVAQFVEHDRCTRCISQRVDPGDEADARDWREAYTTMNSALLGTGQEFEATQIEQLAADAIHVIGPDLTDANPDAAGVTDLDIDETWAASTRNRQVQLQDALETAAAAPPNDHPYVLLYQAPLDGILGDHDLHGDADCIALAPAATIPAPNESTDDPLEPTTMPTEADVIARVIDCKSAHDQQPGHHVQVASYRALLEQALGEGPPESDPAEVSASEQTDATADTGAQAPPSVGVVTPHNAQRGALTQVLPAAHTANTVEKYQGGERDVMVVSGTVSDPEFARREEQFLLNPRRLLVAISRARLLTVVVCSSALFEVAPEDSDRLDEGPVWARLFAQTVGREATPAWTGTLDSFTHGAPDTDGSVPVRVYPVSVGGGDA